MSFLNEEQESFSNYLNRLAEDPDDDLVLADFKEAEDLVEASKGFHWQSPSLLTRRKKHLREYYYLVRIRYKLPPVYIEDPHQFAEKEETDVVAFPVQEKVLLNNLKV